MANVRSDGSAINSVVRHFAALLHGSTLLHRIAAECTIPVAAAEATASPAETAAAAMIGFPLPLAVAGLEKPRATTFTHLP